MQHFYIGLHQPSDARHFDHAFISVNRLDRLKGDIKVNNWIMDSGAFTNLGRDGYFTKSPAEYAKQIKRWSLCGNLVAACTQDFMCEAFMFDGQESEDDWNEYSAAEGDDGRYDAYDCPECDYDPVGVADHQRLTVDRYVAIKGELEAIDCDTPLMAVLQGFAPAEYVDCIRLYEAAGALEHGAFVGVGSVCKRNGDPAAVLEVLRTIKAVRPDLRIHGFGLKKTALEDPAIRALLETSDSMAWSDAARKNRNKVRKAGGDWKAEPSQNDWREAKRYSDAIDEVLEVDELEAAFLWA